MGEWTRWMSRESRVISQPRSIDPLQKRVLGASVVCCCLSFAYSVVYHCWKLSSRSPMVTAHGTEDGKWDRMRT